MRKRRTRDGDHGVGMPAFRLQSPMRSIARSVDASSVPQERVHGGPPCTNEGTTRVAMRRECGVECGLTERMAKRCKSSPCACQGMRGNQPSGPALPRLVRTSAIGGMHRSIPLKRRQTSPGHAGTHRCRQKTCAQPGIDRAVGFFRVGLRWGQRGQPVRGGGQDWPPARRPTMRAAAERKSPGIAAGARVVRDAGAGGGQAACCTRSERTRPPMSTIRATRPSPRMVAPEMPLMRR